MANWNALFCFGAHISQCSVNALLFVFIFFAALLCLISVQSTAQHYGTLSFFKPLNVNFIFLCELCFALLVL